MKTEELKKALELLKPAILDQDLIPVLRHVCFRNSEAVAFNDIIAVVVPLQFEEGDCCVPGTTLHSFLSTVSSSSQLKISHNEGVMQIKAGRSKVELPTLDVREFFFSVPEFRAALEFEVEDDFLAAVEYVAPAVGDASMTSMELGVVLHARERNSSVTLYATDNLMLSSATVDVGEAAVKSVSCIIPKDFCMRLSSMCSVLPEMPEISLSENHIVAHFKASGVTLYSKTVEPLRKGRLADDVEETERMVDEIISSSEQDPLDFEEPKQLLDSLKRAAIFVRDDIDGMVTFSSEEGDSFVMVEAGTDKAGNIEDRINLRSDNEVGFCVTVKLQQMLDAVVKTGDDSIIPTTRGAMTFWAEEKEVSFLTLVAYKEDNEYGDEE